MDDVARYDRQIRIGGWGRSGQRKLRQASLMVAGAGGLGSTAAMLLAAAGVGHITVVDMDIVEVSNLNRQPLHWEKDVGTSKAASAREKLAAMNSEISITALPFAIDADSVDVLLEDVDGIVDGLDNFETRYLLNEEAVSRGLPFFHGSVYGMEGRVTTILPGKSPCLRCIYESAPGPGPVPVVGTTPSFVASLQAMEAIKCIVGVGSLLVGRMLVIDGEDSSFSEIQISRNPRCPVCGELPPSA